MHAQVAEWSMTLRERQRGPRERMFDHLVCHKRSFKVWREEEEGGEPRSLSTAPALREFGPFVPLHSQ